MTTFDKGINMKTCNKCKKEKPLSDFHICSSKKDGRTAHCKECRNKASRERAKKIGNDKLYQIALSKNPERYKRKRREYYEKNKQEIINRVAKWRKDNPEARRREYQNSRDEKIAYAKKWASENKEKRRQISRAYKERFNSDPANRPYIICRKLLARVVNLKPEGKTGKTEKMLGYTRGQLKSHIESLFADGMSWSNHGEWHIDHIKPVSLFIAEGETDPKVINALSNLQPLWAKDNLSKGAKYDPE